MGLPALWLRARYARLLLAAKWHVADGDYQAARHAVERIVHLHEARDVEVPLRADIMSALVAWNFGDYAATAVYVRCAAGKIDRRLATQPRLRHELNYLRAYCWTLLYYSEISGASVQWDDFADLVTATYVKVESVSRTTREMFPVDEQVFVLAEP